ncbi:MAG: hypothetical protein VYC95_05395, partial [Verrucomicrobiota bacterium]|nr:hypothetical protein [Verrucomicrobiota bacterium]
MAYLAKIAGSVDGLRQMDKDGLAVQTPGTLKALGHLERALLYLVRACDQFNVLFGRGAHGHDLARMIFHAMDLGGRDLQAIQYPTLPSPRLALLIPAVQWGGRDHESAPQASLLAADFPKARPQDFDTFVRQADLKLGPKPPKARVGTLDEWRKHCFRAAWTFAIHYGAEYYVHLHRLVSFLAEGAEFDADRYPFHVVQAIFEWCLSSFCWALRELYREFCVQLQNDHPTLEDLLALAFVPRPPAAHSLYTVPNATPPAPG